MKHYNPRASRHQLLPELIFEKMNLYFESKPEIESVLQSQESSIELKLKELKILRSFVRESLLETKKLSYINSMLRIYFPKTSEDFEESYLPYDNYLTIKKNNSK